MRPLDTDKSINYSLFMRSHTCVCVCLWEGGTQGACELKGLMVFTHARDVLIFNRVFDSHVYQCPSLTDRID